MESYRNNRPPGNADYHGRILTGDYTPRLKERIAAAIDSHVRFEAYGSPAITYISAWHRDKMAIWYEFTSENFRRLLDCTSPSLAERFRQSIIDQRIYRYQPGRAEIGKEVIGRNRLGDASRELRRTAEHKGAIEALYKLSAAGDQVVWLKDQAVVTTHEADGICLSTGCLTVVTKEIRSEEERLARERLQVALETAGGVCHELNQPLQSVAGYAELIMQELDEQAPLAGKIRHINEQVHLMGDITTKLMEITEYRTRNYPGGEKIMDIHGTQDPLADPVP